MQNARLTEAQDGIKIALSECRWRHPMAESEKELKNLIMKVKKKSKKTDLKLNIQQLRSWHLVSSLHDS